MYKSEGWKYYEKEVRLFENEIRQKIEEDRKRLMDIRRYQRSQRFGYPPGSMGDGNIAMEVDENTIDIDAENPQPILARCMGPSAFPPLLTSPPIEGELYPFHQGRGVEYPGYYDSSIPIAPTLLATGYGHPKLNWHYIYKQRRRLEDNWVCNRYTNFQIPHPGFPDEGHRECIYTIQYSTRYLISGSRDKTIRKWGLHSRRLIGEPMRGHSGSVLCLQFDESPEEDIIISGSSDSSVIIWQFSTGKRINIISRAHQEAILNLKFNKTYLVTCSKDKLIKVWNKVELTTNMPEYPFSSKHLFRHNRIIPVPGQSIGAMMRIQDPIYAPIPPWSTIQVLHGHGAAVNAIQLHGDEIASASGDRVIKIWNIHTGHCERTMVGHSKGIACIQYDGKTVVSGSSDFSIRIFDRSSGADIYRLGGHTGLVRTVQASRDRIVSGSYDETVRVWARRGALRGLLNEGEDPNSFVQAAVLKEGNNPHTHATAWGMGIAAVNGNSLLQIHQVLANQQRQQRIAHNIHQHPPLHHQGHPHHHHFHQNIQQIPPVAQHIPQNIQQIPPPAHHLPQNTHEIPPVVQHIPHNLPQPHPMQMAQPIPHLQHHQHHGNHGNHYNQGNGVNNNCKVFKLQFDTRWVICCCQDGKIMGWDFANNEPELMEVCRLFKAD